MRFTLRWIIACSWVCGITAAASFAVSAPTNDPLILGSDSLLPVGALLVAVGLTWHFSRKVAHFEARLDALESGHEKFAQTMLRMEAKIDRLPCHADCPR